MWDDFMFTAAPAEIQQFREHWTAQIMIHSCHSRASNYMFQAPKFARMLSHECVRRPTRVRPQVVPMQNPFEPPMVWELCAIGGPNGAVSACAPKELRLDLAKSCMPSEAAGIEMILARDCSVKQWRNKTTKKTKSPQKLLNASAPLVRMFVPQ